MWKDDKCWTGTSPPFLLSASVFLIPLGAACGISQICVCPDYVLIPRHAQDAFVSELREAYDTFYPSGSPLDSPSFGSIINNIQYNRLKDLKKRTDGKMVLGGGEDEKRRRMEPTVWKDVKEGDSLLETEIFGPFLPIVPVEDIDEAIEYINNQWVSLHYFRFA